MKVTALWGVIVVGLLAGCSGKQNGTAAEEDDENLIEEATLLRMADVEGYTRVEILNPWREGDVLGKYVLVERGEKPDSLPGGYTVVEVPLERSIVYSSVHSGLIEELGAGERIAGVADGEYFTREPMKGRIASGEVKNVGSSMAPSLESIVALKADAVLMSPFENAGHGVIDQSGTTVIECADYMEGTPRGRAEWMKLIGALYGKRAEAGRLYEDVTARYDSIAREAGARAQKPLVLTEMLTDGYWFVPGGESYMARMIEDAGGRYAWSGDRHSGSLQLDFSTVYATAGDADVWLLKSFGRDLSYDDLKSMYRLNSQIKAFKTRDVLGANTAEVPLFDEFPFHPDLLLEEYSRIFSGEREGLRYFKSLK